VEQAVVAGADDEGRIVRDLRRRQDALAPQIEARGARVPAHVVSPGCVILSTFAKAKLDAWLAAHTFSKFTPQTVTEASRYRENVQRARELGYWSVQQHVNVGLGGIAVAVTDRKGQCVGAVSMTFQTQAYPRESFLVKLLPALQEAAQAIRAVA
jgi:IclR family pca regulon transcriptional regulator